jgi:hypothetical protein
MTGEQACPISATRRRGPLVKEWESATAALAA